MEGYPSQENTGNITNHGNNDTLDALFDEYEVLSNELKINLFLMGVTMEKLMTMTEVEILMLERLNSFQTHLSCDLILLVGVVKDYKRKLSSNHEQHAESEGIESKQFINSSIKYVAKTDSISNGNINNDHDTMKSSICRGAKQLTLMLTEKIHKFVSRHHVQIESIEWLKIICWLIFFVLFVYVTYLTTILMLEQYNNFNLNHGLGVNDKGIPNMIDVYYRNGYFVDDFLGYEEQFLEQGNYEQHVFSMVRDWLE